MGSNRWRLKMTALIEAADFISWLAQHHPTVVVELANRTRNVVNLWTSILASDDPPFVTK